MGTVAFVSRISPLLLASRHPVAYLCLVIGMVVLRYFSLVPKTLSVLQRDVLRLAKPVQSIVLPFSLVPLQRAWRRTGSCGRFHLQSWRASWRLVGFKPAGAQLAQPAHPCELFFSCCFVQTFSIISPLPPAPMQNDTVHWHISSLALISVVAELFETLKSELWLSKPGCWEKNGFLQSHMQLKRNLIKEICL